MFMTLIDMQQRMVEVWRAEGQLICQGERESGSNFREREGSPCFHATFSELFVQLLPCFGYYHHEACTGDLFRSQQIAQGTRINMSHVLLPRAMAIFLYGLIFSSFILLPHS